MSQRRPLLLAGLLAIAVLLAAAVPTALHVLRPKPQALPPAALLLYTAPLDEAAARSLSGVLRPMEGWRLQAAAPAAARQAVQQGKAAAALYVTVPGEADPAGLTAEVLAVDDSQVLLQPWLDPALSLTAAQATDLLAGRLARWEELPGAAAESPALHRTGPIRWQKALPLPAPGSGEPAQPLPAPASGELAVAPHADLHPGWLPVTVDGVLPTAEALRTGRYPLARRLLLLRPAGAAANAAPGAITFPAPFVAAADLRDPITLTAVGDFMLSRAVAPLILRHGPQFLLAGVQDELRGDLLFGNLESPIGVKGRPIPDKGIWFRAPPEAVDVLKAAHVTAVTVANNHILDYDTENFLETIETLNAAGIKYAGGGRDLEEARRPTVISAGGVRVAIVAASAFGDIYYSSRYPRRFAATDSLPGVVPLREDYLAEDIRKARTMADVVLVTFHWGIEYQNFPTPEMVRLAHFAVDQGADLVLGHHPHAIQGFDLYKGKFIAYSMGNFIMDDQSLGRLPQESMILHIALTPRGVQSVAVTPVLAPQIGRPEALHGDAAATLMEKYRRISGWDEPGGKVPGW